MVKLIWILTALNALAFVIFFGIFLVDSASRNVDSMEKGWMGIIAIAGIIVILLGVIPVRFSRSGLSLGISLFFAALPLIVISSIWISNHLPTKKQPSFPVFYFKEKTQQQIAAAIELGDTARLQEALAGQDIQARGNRVNDEEGLNYLQYALYRRGNTEYLERVKTSDEMIRILVDKGIETTSSLPDAVKLLPPKLFQLLLDHGGNPNTHGWVSGDPLLFEAIGTTKLQNDNAILLIKKGADVNAKNSDGLTPLIYTAQNASTTTVWADSWRVIRYLIEEAHADISYTPPGGNNLSIVIKGIQTRAAEEKVTLHPDFYAVVKLLEKGNQ